LSFFEDDDEPTRRTPRPRRAAPAGGTTTRRGGVDPSTVRTRQAVAVGAAILIVVLLALVVNACQDSRHKNALRDYNREAGSLVQQSDDEVGRAFFDTLRQGASQSPEDLQTQVSSLRVQSETLLKQARRLDVPGDVTGAQDSLLTSLELRRDGLDYIAQRISTALGNEGDVADQAIEGIAGQMQSFLASDVLLRARVTPLVRDAMKDADISADPLTTSGFMPGFSWLDPAYVADQLGTSLSNNGTGRQNSKEITPGLHGTGLTSTEVNGVTLQPDPAANKVPIAGDLTFKVTFANQGENDEFDVPVSVTLQGSGKPITGKKTVDTIAQGASATVNIALPSKPTAGEVYTVNVEVKAVPGEKKTDNNKSTYNVLFQ
jgi:CARDB